MDSSETNSKADEKEVPYWYDLCVSPAALTSLALTFHGYGVGARYANGGDDGDQPTVRIDAAGGTKSGNSQCLGGRGSVTISA